MEDALMKRAVVLFQDAQIAPRHTVTSFLGYGPQVNNVLNIHTLGVVSTGRVRHACVHATG